MPPGQTIGERGLAGLAIVRAGLGAGSLGFAAAATPCSRVSRLPRAWYKAVSFAGSRKSLLIGQDEAGALFDIKKWGDAAANGAVWAPSWSA